MLNPPPDEFHQPVPPIAPIHDNENAAESTIETCADPNLSKKTRDLPNLADCHSCGFRINISDGKNRLRTLNSEWRIVLLCRKCYKLCARGNMCTYCFKEVLGAEMQMFKCGECCCCVHNECVESFSEFPPWSYYDWRKEGVCVDCWLPDKVKKLREVREGERRVRNYLGGGRSENDVNYSVDQERPVGKARMAVKGRGKSFCRALVGKENGGMSSNGGLGGKRRGFDDAELAFQLHRSMNSSPRISRNFGQASFSHVNMKQRRSGKYLSSGQMSAFKQRHYSGSGRFSGSLIKGYDGKDENVDGPMKEGQGSSNNSMDSEPSFSKELELPTPELKFTYVRRKDRPDVDGSGYQYMFKYSRKKSRLKQSVARKYTYLYDRSSYETEISSTAIVLHSSSETRKFPDSCILALPVSVPRKDSSRNKI